MKVYYLFIIHLARLHIFINDQLMPQEQQSVSVIERQPVILRCASNGTFTNIRWAVFLGSGNEFNRHVFSDTLQYEYESIIRDQEGRFTCAGSNSDIFEESVTESVSIYIDVMYPPENPVITGALTAIEGENLNLTCQAESNPPCTYLWSDRDHPDGEVLTRGSAFTAPVEPPGVLFCIVENFMQSTFGDSVNARVAKKIDLLIQDNKDPTVPCECPTNYTRTKEYDDKDGIVLSTGTYYGLISAATVGFLVALVTMVIMAYVCVRFRRFRKRIGSNHCKSWYRPELPKRHVSRDENCQSNHTYLDLRETRSSHQGTNQDMKDMKENNDGYLTPTSSGLTKLTSLGPDKNVDSQLHYDVISDSLDMRQTNSDNVQKF